MRVFFIVIFIVWANCLFAQKQIIDSNAYASWPTLDGLRLSGDGKYVIYDINNVPFGSKTAVLQSIDGKFKREYIGKLEGAWFSSDSQSLFFKSSDSLGIMNIEKNTIRYIPHVSSFTLQEYGNHQWLCYFSVGTPHKLIIKDLKTNKERYYNDVIKWQFSKDDKVLLLWQKNADDPKLQLVNWLNVGDGVVSKIWQGDEISNLLFDEKHDQLTFEVSGSIWYYKLGSTSASCIINENTKGIPNGLILGNVSNFSRDGSSVFFSLKEKAKPKPLDNEVEVWSYRDIKLQSEQNEFEIKSYLYVFDLNDKGLTCLQENPDDGLMFPESKDAPDTLALYSSRRSSMETWIIGNKPVFSLISTRDGKRKDLNLPSYPSFSPSGKYLLYFDSKVNSYFSYEIETSIIRNLTKDLNVSWKNVTKDDCACGSVRGSVWLKNDEAILVYDSHDIWKIDPSNKLLPINLTNGYGKRHNVIFTFTFEQDVKNDIKSQNKHFLTAFCTENKNNGFYHIRLDKAHNPELLTMKPYVFDLNTVYFEGLNFTPVKARNANIYVVRKMSANQAPNYFSTKDFKTYKEISNLHPEKEYNWYITELHTWESLDGRALQGILYKPENFDPKKKYPVIFCYYERLSDGLNSYITPEPLCRGCKIDIPTYVSNGYLVFVPDIYYKIGDPMQGTYDAVVSAAKYISSFSYVNSKKMGIQGCSFGGFQTNYLVTHTDLFAAACSASGISNLVSGYGSLSSGKYNQHEFHENGQLRMGTSLWDRQDAYINNSAIFSVDKVSTPLLIMHTKNDGICLYSDALQFFTGLRRMGKKAWMLAYPNENHGLFMKKNADDFSLRMMQFFNHYLKDKSAPVWMTKGIPASRRGLENGYEYDTEVQTPGRGLLNEVEQAKVDSLMSRKPVTITLR